MSSHVGQAQMWVSVLLESVALEDLDDMKNNLVELEKVHKEGLNNLKLELTEALSSHHRSLKN